MAKLTIDLERCKGCLLCTQACPKKILVQSKELNQKGYYPIEIIDQSQCIGCAMCALMCPDCVIRVEK
jgi:2-oxoglutarate ferredoxin oxidoreductase subunit delta